MRLEVVVRLISTTYGQQLRRDRNVFRRCLPVVVQTAISPQTEDGGRISDLKMAALQRPSTLDQTTDRVSSGCQETAPARFKNYGAVLLTNISTTLCGAVRAQVRRVGIGLLLEMLGTIATLPLMR